MGYEFMSTGSNVKCRLARSESFVNEQNLLVSVDVESAGVEMFNGRQPRARGRVLTSGAETGTVHDSSRPDTLWCPVLCALSDLRLIV